jgi:hypothetical protein
MLCGRRIDVLWSGKIDLMTNASRMGCLPEQGSAYWDAVLAPTQAAWIALELGKRY